MPRRRAPAARPPRRGRSAPGARTQVRWRGVRPPSETHREDPESAGSCGWPRGRSPGPGHETAAGGLTPAVEATAPASE